MNVEKVVACYDKSMEKSNYPKRTRYEMNATSASKWSLTRNELVLHTVYDRGIRQLESDNENDENEFKSRVHVPPAVATAASTRFPQYTPYTKSKETTVAESSLPDNTFQKLHIGDLDHILANKCTADNQWIQPVEMNYFDTLSDEVILFILQRLPRCELSNVALVCRRFYCLTEDESLWSRMDICNKCLDKGAFGRIMSRQVLILRVSRCTILDPPIYGDVKASLSDYRCRLMYLDLSMSTISLPTLTTILSKCNKLKKLGLENVPVSNEVLIALSGNRELEVVNFAMCTGMGKLGLQHFLKWCRMIRELNLGWTYLNSDCISYICENLPPNLDRFNFSGCRKMLQDKHVHSLVMKCRRIRELDLSDCTSITGHSILHITLLEDLNFLALSRCYLIPPRSIINLSSLRKLTFLDVHGGYIGSDDLKIIRDGLGVHVRLNQFKFSSVARPTVGSRKMDTIWNISLRQ